MSEFEIEPGAVREDSVLSTEEPLLDDLEELKAQLEEITTFEHSEESSELSACNENQEEVIEGSENGLTEEEEDELDWTNKKKHIFVISNSGKPIYTRHGNENKLSWLFGLMLVLFKYSQDSLRSMHAGDTTYVFLEKKPLVLVAVSKTGESVAQLSLQLNYVFNQIISMLTINNLIKTYEQRPNYDLRRLLTGVDRLIDHLITFSEEEPSFTLGAVQCLSLPVSERDAVSKAIKDACSKIKDVFFAILLAKNRLIALVQMKKYHLHPIDLHLLFNLVQSTESLKYSEVWTPLCLPKFDSTFFLHTHASYLSDDCQACLLIMTRQTKDSVDLFSQLSQAKQKIVEKLRMGNHMEHINSSLSSMEETALSAGFPELRHYLYKCKSTAQFYQPSICPPYTLDKGRLMTLYRRAHQKVHCPTRPLKLSFERSTREAVFSWDTKGFELFAVFEPLIETANVINCVSKLLNWIKKREDKLFHLNAYTF